MTEMQCFLLSGEQKAALRMKNCARKERRDHTHQDGLIYEGSESERTIETETQAETESERASARETEGQRARRAGVSARESFVCARGCPDALRHGQQTHARVINQR